MKPGKEVRVIEELVELEELVVHNSSCGKSMVGVVLVVDIAILVFPYLFPAYGIVLVLKVRGSHLASEFLYSLKQSLEYHFN